MTQIGLIHSQWSTEITDTKTGVAQGVRTEHGMLMKGALS